MASEQSKKCYLFDNERSQKPKNSTLYIHENLSFDICTAICALQNKATEREIMTYKWGSEQTESGHEHKCLAESDKLVQSFKQQIKTEVTC